MRRFISLLLVGLLCATPLAPLNALLLSKGNVATATTFIVLGKATAALSASTRFFPLAYSGPASVSAVKSTLVPIAGTLTSLRFYAVVPPTGTQTWTGTVYRNGSATSQTCVINASSSPVGVCTSTTAVTVAAGDYLDFQAAPANGPSATFLSWSVVVTPTTPNDTFITGVGSAYSTTAVNAGNPFVSAAVTVPSNRRAGVLPDGGVLDKLQILSTAPGTAGSGQYYDFSIGKNGSVTAVVARITETATTNNDLSNTATYTAGDDVQFIGTPSATAPISATATFGARYVPSTVGSFMLASATQSASGDNASTAVYYPLSSGLSSNSATESNVQNVSDAMTITKIQVKLSVAPGAAASGKSRRLEVRVNGANSGLFCDVVETALTCNQTGSVTVNNNDLLSVSDVPTGTPAVSFPAITVLATR